MKKVLGMLVFIFLICTGVAAAEEPQQIGGVVVSTASGSATVQDIDYATRTVTLKFDNGSVETDVVGPEVRNFNQINKGDKVNINYTGTAVITVGGPAEPLSREESVQVQGAPLGQKPAGSIDTVTNISCVVEDIDYANRLVTVKGPQRTVRVKIDPQVANLEKVKKGDTVLLNITETLTINVTAPQEPVTQK